MPVGATAATAITIGAMAGTAGAGIYAAHRQGQTADAASRIEQDSTRQALLFQSQQERTRKAEFERTQALNQANYLEEQRYAREQAALRTQRAAPFVQAGGNSLGTLMRPLYNASGQGSLGELMGRR